MKHYDYVEWILYKNKRLSLVIMEEMEDHLYNCHTCMDIFLSLIDEEEIKRGEKFISQDFNSKVIGKISDKKLVPIETKTKKFFSNKFGYYVAVASFTILVTFGGFYTNLVDSIPRITERLEMERDKASPNFIGDFSNKIVDSTSKVLLSIENNDGIRRNKDER